MGEIRWYKGWRRLVNLDLWMVRILFFLLGSQAGIPQIF